MADRIGLETQAVPEADPRAILTRIGKAVYDWDIVSDSLIFGPNTAEIADFAEFAKAQTGQAYAEFLSPESGGSRFAAIMGSKERDCGRGVAFHVIYGLKSKVAGRGQTPTVWIEDVGRWFAGADGRPAHAHGLVRVMADRDEIEGKALVQSRWDTLTGAVSRSHFVARLSVILAEQEQSGRARAILLVAIDELARLNEAYGYDLGDEFIAAAAARLRCNLRGKELFARYSGNIFAVLLEACNAEQMKIAAARIEAAFDSAPLETSKGPIKAAIRVGGIEIAQKESSGAAVLREAEQALEASWRTPAPRLAPALRAETAPRSQGMSQQIIDALNQSRLRLALQPIVDAKTGGVRFYEVLARLGGEDGNLIPPEAIIPTAEEAGIVHLIDQRMLDLTFAELESIPALRLAVNVSGLTLNGKEWTERLLALSARHKSAAERLIVEITETCAVRDLNATREIIGIIKGCGAQVAMDDFGSGHTSFRNLRQLPLDFLKIDGAFVQNLSKSEDDRFFVRTLIDLARHLEIPTVAEWVEDAQSAALLAEWGIDYLQGFFLGAPQVALHSFSKLAAAI
ncbi:MAG: bifunctional diguanylate cyclase/phosphodiesterase [Methylovirgula sp.]|nr:bifunctional diguanylate cyclase/phosphodiesterase [Methylovirgula sp.]